jgi:hypothetical protein
MTPLTTRLAVHSLRRKCRALPVDHKVPFMSISNVSPAIPPAAYQATPPAASPAAKTPASNDAPTQPAACAGSDSHALNVQV